jgi:hypothetical protein
MGLNAAMPGDVQQALERKISELVFWLSTCAPCSSAPSRGRRRPNSCLRLPGPNESAPPRRLVHVLPGDRARRALRARSCNRLSLDLGGNSDCRGVSKFVAREWCRQCQGLARVRPWGWRSVSSSLACSSSRRRQTFGREDTQEEARGVHRTDMVQGDDRSVPASPFLVVRPLLDAFGLLYSRAVMPSLRFCDVSSALWLCV